MDNGGDDHWLYRCDLCFRDQSVCLGGIKIMTKNLVMILQHLVRC